MKTYLAPSYLICNFSSLLASLPAVLLCYLFLMVRVGVLALVVGHGVRTGHAGVYRGLSGGACYIGCFLARGGVGRCASSPPEFEIWDWALGFASTQI